MTLTVLSTLEQISREPEADCLENISFDSEPKSSAIPSQPGTLFFNSSHLGFFSELAQSGFQLSYKSILIHAKSKKNSLTRDNSAQNDPQQPEETLRQFGDCIYCQLDFALSSDNEESETHDSFTELFITAENEAILDVIYSNLSKAISLIPLSDCSDEEIYQDEPSYEHGEIISDHKDTNLKHRVPNSSVESDIQTTIKESPIEQVSNLGDLSSEFYFSSADIDKLSEKGKKTLDHLDNLLNEAQ
ncbi:hypothetical protein BB561_001455 [Smittium simulii]|uniref:Uncharacterized protein n=1 Tax=Smittium simulii TaxID=133385 RepID=A0A2T9YUI4_9FUNG|nr:hypothetical protein BB561_001455 [Smittium simulii]